MIRAALALTISVFFLCSCGGTNKESVKQQGGPATVEEGWFSDTQFRVKVTAEAESSVSDRETIKKASEKAAIKRAREVVVKNFVAIRMRQTPSAGTYAVAAISIDRDFRDVIENGKVITKTFSDDDRKCTIVYQVENKDLKKSVEAAPKK